MRRILLISMVLLIAYIASTVAIRYIRYATTPEWRKRLPHVDPIPIYPNSEVSVKTQQVENYICSELIRKKAWGEHEMDEIRGYVQIPSIRDEQVVTSDEFDNDLLEIWSIRDSALNCIADRMNAGAPIDEEYRQELIDMITAGLYQNESFLSFSFAAPRVIHSGLADTQGPIRDRLLYIYEHPKEFFGNDGLSVAENIKRQLKGRGVFILDGETHEG